LSHASRRMFGSSPATVALRVVARREAVVGFEGVGRETRRPSGSHRPRRPVSHSTAPSWRRVARSRGSQPDQHREATTDRPTLILSTKPSVTMTPSSRHASAASATRQRRPSRSIANTSHGAGPLQPRLRRPRRRGSSHRPTRSTASRSHRSPGAPGQRAVDAGDPERALPADLLHAGGGGGVEAGVVHRVGAADARALHHTDPRSSRPAPVSVATKRSRS
jgi:hypothetical protein